MSISEFATFHTLFQIPPGGILFNSYGKPFFAQKKPGGKAFFAGFGKKTDFLLQGVFSFRIFEESAFCAFSAKRIWPILPENIFRLYFGENRIQAV